MNDTARCYRAIKQSRMQRYHPHPTGRREPRLNTLAALIYGLAGGKHAHLPTIIETFFADQKRRGSPLHQSPLSDPARLSRLLIAACLAYLWLEPVMHFGS